MASDSTVKPVNGNYGNLQQYNPQEQQLSSQGSAGDITNGSAAINNSSATANEGNGGVPKDEVGWYFVEQYYTTLSKSPEKLHVSPLTPYCF